jgi:hypothetical protein
MADIHARQRQLVGSAADWGAADLVIGDGELAVQREAGDQFKIKLGNGVQKFSQLPFFESFSLAQGDARYLQITNAYDKTQADARYLQIANAYDRTQADARYLQISNAFTQTAADARYVPLSARATAGGAGSANKVPQLDASGLLASTMMPQAWLDGRYIQLSERATAGGAANAGKVARLDTTTGLLADSMMPHAFLRRDQSTDHAGATSADDVAQAGFAVLLNSTGHIAPQLVQMPHVMRYLGLWDPTAQTPDYPTGQHNEGDVFVVSVAAPFTFPGGDLHGQIARNGDMMIYAANGKWELLDNSLKAGETPTFGGLILTGDLVSSGRIYADRGTAALPGYGFRAAADRNDGMFMPADNVLGFATAGVERMKIDASGNVGIGMTPSAKLEILAESNESVRIFSSTAYAGIQLKGSANTGTVSIYEYGDSFYIYTNGTPRLQVNKEGMIFAQSIHNNPSGASSKTPMLASGTYTPVVTPRTNTTSASAAWPAQWMRVGNVVTVSGQLNIAATVADLASNVTISLPIPSTFTDYGDVGGVSSATMAVVSSGRIGADPSSGTAVMTYNVKDTVTGLHSFTFTYVIK